MTASQSAPASNTVPDLAYIALACRDTNRVSEFLGDHLKLPSFEISLPTQDTVNAFRVGQTALLAVPLGNEFLSEDSSGIDHIAIASEAPEAAANATGLPLHDRPYGPGSARQVSLDRSATCGVALRYSPMLQLPPVPASQTIERLDHIGIASANNEAAENVFCGPIGASYESRQTDMEIATAIESFTSDKYGAVYHTRQPQPIGGLRVSFLTVGDLELEFLQDFDPSQGFDVKHGAPGTTKQDQSAIGRFVKTRGGGLHHIALKVRDIDAVLRDLAEQGHQLIDKVGRPGSRRSRIGFVHPSSTGGVLFHFVERAELST